MRPSGSRVLTTQYGVGSFGSVTSIRTTGPTQPRCIRNAARIELRPERDLLVRLGHHVDPADVAQGQSGRAYLQLVVDHPHPDAAEADHDQNGHRHQYGVPDPGPEPRIAHVHLGAEQHRHRDGRQVPPQWNRQPLVEPSGAGRRRHRGRRLLVHDSSG